MKSTQMQKNQKHEHAVAKQELVEYFWNVRTLIGVLATLLALFFGFLKLKDLPVGVLTTSTSVRIIHEVTLIIWYCSWVRGTLNDTKVMAKIFISAPSRGQIMADSILVAGSVAIGFGALCYVRDTRFFLAWLIVFWVINLFAWRFLVTKKISRIIENTKAYYEKKKQFIELEKVAVVADYITGYWQYKRFLVGGCLFLAGIPLTIDYSANWIVAHIIRIQDVRFLSAAWIFILICFVEQWVWKQRVNVVLRIKLLDKLFENYNLTKKKSDALERKH